MKDEEARHAAPTNYEALSRAELMKLRADLDHAIAKVGDRDKRAAFKAAEEAAREHGFSLAELVPPAGKGADRAAKSQAKVRFRNPENSEQTWSGRGRRPAWFSDALAAGRSAEDMSVS